MARSEKTVSRIKAIDETIKEIVRSEIKRLGNGADLNHIDVSCVTNMKNLFRSSKFDGDVSKWDVSNVTDMAEMFSMTPFNGDVSKWDVSSVHNMSLMFESCDFDGDLSKWDVSNVTNMADMFRISYFKGDISKWDVSNVTNMYNMFNSSRFNGDISKWDVSNVTNMAGMFSFSIFKGDISKWDVSNVTNMAEMFYGSIFNGDLSNWDVSNVTNMTGMFSFSIFKGDLSNWYVSNVRSMRYMFFRTKYIGDLSSWNVSYRCDTKNMFSYGTPYLPEWYIKKTSAKAQPWVKSHINRAVKKVTKKRVTAPKKTAAKKATGGVILFKSDKPGEEPIKILEYSRTSEEITPPKELEAPKVTKKRVTAPKKRAVKKVTTKRATAPKVQKKRVTAPKKRAAKKVATKKATAPKVTKKRVTAPKKTAVKKVDTKKATAQNNAKKVLKFNPSMEVLRYFVKMYQGGSKPNEAGLILFLRYMQLRILKKLITSKSPYADLIMEIQKATVHRKITMELIEKARKIVATERLDPTFKIIRKAVYRSPEGKEELRRSLARVRKNKLVKRANISKDPVMGLGIVPASQLLETNFKSCEVGEFKGVLGEVSLPFSLIISGLPGGGKTTFVMQMGKYFSNQDKKHEGGFVHHKNDRGGATNKGITLQTWERFGVDINQDGRRDVRDLRLITDAQALAIYKRQFWDKVKGDQIADQSIAEIIFDHAVNAGVSRASKMAQYILNTRFEKRLRVDGIIGKNTLKAINSLRGGSAPMFFQIFLQMRRHYYNYLANGEVPRRMERFFSKELRISPSNSQKTFINGWIKRVESFSPATKLSLGLGSALAIVGLIYLVKKK
ncbi:surface protein [Elysia marginata]|uniref:Surface protein n=1 Tax=Elysia marginata TaxID=1093978 RepID=A0AAV4JV26_9GAST|nr:surface protein [Elysia marginata]